MLGAGNHRIRTATTPSPVRLKLKNSSITELFFNCLFAWLEYAQNVFAVHVVIGIAELT